jgi:hypothetical protein
MQRRVVFTLPALSLSGSILAYSRWETSSPKPALDVPEIRIPSGTALHVRLGRELDAVRNRAGDGFYAVLETAVFVDGQVAIPWGAGFHGQIASARPGGVLKGPASLVIRLDSFELRGRTYAVVTTPHDVAGESQSGRGGGLIGAVRGVGTLVGAAVGGKPPAHIPAGTVLTFALKDSVWVGRNAF